MVLRRTGGPCPVSSVSHSIDGLTQHPVEEEHIVGNHTSSEMVGEIVTAANNSIDILISVWHNQLEGTEELLTAKLEVGQELTQWHIHSSGLVCAINLRDGVICEWFSTKAQLSSWNGEHLVDMILDALVVPSEHWPNSQVLQLSPRCQSSNFIDKASFDPILMREYNRLGRTLLS